MTPDKMQEMLQGGLDQFFTSIAAPLFIMCLIFALLWMVRRPHDAREDPRHH